MITIDCTNSDSIKDKLLVYIADKLALPTLKDKKFMISAIDDTQNIEKQAVVTAIKEFLEEKKLEEIINVIEGKDDDRIIVEIVSGKEIKENKRQVKKQVFFECTHCGFMTQYETELRNHRLIHYI